MTRAAMAHVGREAVGTIGPWGTDDVGTAVDLGTAVSDPDRLALESALADAVRAAGEAERRLRLLTDATVLVSGALDPVEAVERMVRLAVPEFADWCLVATVDADQVVVLHRDPALQQTAEALRRHILASRTASRPVQRVLSGGQPTLFPVVTGAALDAQVSDPVLRQAYRALGMRSVIIAPLWARGQVIGNVSFVIADPARLVYTEADAATATELAQRTALTLDNARLIARERAAAETLQRSLLPELPVIAGMTIAARYLPANAHAQVGGDWYDVLPLPDGSVGVAIGDVMGHDLEAAAAMGQLRSVLRGYAWDGAEPVTVLSQLDRLVRGLGMAQLATAVYGRLQVLPYGGARLDYANAGHLPPLVRQADGTTMLLDRAHAPLIGLPVVVDRDQDTVALPAGSTLVLYTDGLVEDRSQPAEEGIARLRAVLEGAPADADPDRLCDLVIEGLRDGSTRADDIALLILRLDADVPPSGCKSTASPGDTGTGPGTAH